LPPATTEVVDMRPDDVADHMSGCMMTRYTVTQ
jgi:hypothetical protein